MSATAIAFVALLGASATGTWLARAYALRRRLLDHPGERRSHSVATPRGGGIAIVVVLLLALAGVVAGPWGGAGPGPLAAFGGGLAMVALAGLVDDHRPLSPWLRLGVHAVAAGWFAAALWHGGASLPVIAVVFLAILVLVNVWNFMDGIDGIAASQAMLVSLGLAAGLQGAWSFLALALVAASLGFLPYNFPRARIFMGDVGSGATGFALAALGGMFVVDAGAGGGLLLLLPLSAFLVDAGLTLLRRVLRGERWWTPHVQHAYQAWARGAGHFPVTVAYAGWTVTGLLLAFALRDVDPVFILSSCVGWYTVAALLWWWLQWRGRSRPEPRTE